MKLALALCLLASPALADAAFESTGEGIIPPPAWIWSRPAVPYTIEHLPDAGLNRTCGFPKRGGGCAFPGSTCRIYLNAGYSRSSVRYRAVRRHELAHCRGWDADHPLDNR